MISFKEYLQEAYVSQDKKKQLEPGINEVLKKYNVRGTIRVRNNSTLIVTLTQGKIDFNSDFIEPRNDAQWRERQGLGPVDLHRGRNVNTYWIKTRWKGTSKKFLTELIDQMKGKDYHDNSDTMTDYFDTSHYIDIFIGRDHDKPYIVR